MGTGTVVAESIRVGERITDLALTITTLSRVNAGDPSVGQPLTWTLIAFTFEDENAKALASVLSRVLDPHLGWYCDLHTADETFVVFADRVFNYPKGNVERREEVAAYARTLGVPESQLDWPL